MKLFNLYVTGILVAVCVSAYAQDEKWNKENTVHAIKVKELTMRKADLQKQIAAEDQKRNQTLEGVSAETRERLNDKQDSVCLALRSQLVSVELELKELVPDRTAAVIAGQIGQLNQNQPSASTAGDE